MSDNHPYLSIIIPCYNEDSVLVETYQRLVRSLNHLNFSFEIIFINDGSTDQTPFILDDFANKDERVLVLHFSRNFGHQQALTAGLHECKGQFAVIMDADLQDPPEIIPENNGAPLASAIPRQSGNATRKTTKPDEKSDLRFAKRVFFFVIYL